MKAQILKFEEADWSAWKESQAEGS